MALRTLETTVLDLRSQVEHRDKEIGMLVTSLKQRSAASQDPFIKNNGSRTGSTTSMEDDSKSFEQLPGNAMANTSASSVDKATASNAPSTSAKAVTSGSATLLDRNQAFEVFRKSVRRTESIEEKKEAVLKLVEEAQALGEKANTVRLHREQVKLKIEKARMERAMECSPRDPEDMVPPQDSPEIVAMLQEMSECKRTYVQHTERMKQVKIEIDNYQRAQAENTKRLQKDFENWFATYAAQQGIQCTIASGSEGSLTASERNPTQRSNSAPAAKPSLPQAPQATTSMSSSSTPEPARTQQSESKAATIRAASFDRSRPSGEAWSSPSSVSEKRRPLSQSSVNAQEHRSPTESRGSVPPRPPSRPNASRTSPVPTPTAANVTGDAETDKTIAEFYAAMAELGK